MSNKLSFDILMAIGSSEEMAAALEAKANQQAAIREQRAIKRLPTVTEYVPPKLPTTNPDIFQKTGQEQIIEDCLCVRCGNRWEQLGVLFDVYRQIDEIGTKIITHLPSELRSMDEPTVKIVSTKKAQCLCCYKTANS